MTDDEKESSSSSVIRNPSSIFRCPRCGKGKLYRNMLDINDQCSICGLSFRAREQGDGPAFFAILLVGTLVAIFAAIVEITYEPPFWVHAALWIPFILLGTLGSLRLLKALLIAVQYRVSKDDFTS